MQITQLDHIQLAMPKGQEGQARAFYGDILALNEIPKPEVLQGRGGVWFTIGEGRHVHLGVDEPFIPNKKAHPCFVCSDLDALAEKLEVAEYPVKWDDGLHPVRRFYTADCFGNRIEFIDRPTFVAL